jgi:hypothetical protein
MQPFVRLLSKLPPEELNEDIDASRLETALRERLRGLDATEAAEAISKDRELLETWLRISASPDHAAYWVLGFLSLPDLGEQLVLPVEPPPQGPTISFEAPVDWKVKYVPFAIHLKKGKVIGEIMVIDELSYSMIKSQQDNNIFNIMKLPKEERIAPPDFEATMEARDICLGLVEGKKYIYKQSAPSEYVRIDYVLSVPGGFVVVVLNYFGLEFDESPLESKLHTLRLSTSK